MKQLVLAVSVVLLIVGCGSGGGGDSSVVEQCPEFSLKSESFSLPSYPDPPETFWVIAASMPGGDLGWTVKVIDIESGEASCFELPQFEDDRAGLVQYFELAVPQGGIELVFAPTPSAVSDCEESPWASVFIPGRAEMGSPLPLPRAPEGVSFGSCD